MTMVIGFDSGMRNHRVTILNKVSPSEKAFGTKTSYRREGSISSSYEFNKGTKALREGALDAYNTVMFRMRWNNIIDRDCLLECEGVTYQIQSLHADRYDNTLLITATEIVK